MPNSVAIKAPTWREVRGRVSYLARSPRQGLGYPSFQTFLLRCVQPAFAALVAKSRQALDAIFQIQTMPSSHRIIVQKQNLRDRRTTHPVIQQDQRVRAPAKPMLSRTITRQCDQILTRFPI